MTVPAGIRTFRFTSLAARDVAQKMGDIRVILESTEVDEQVWKVNVVLEYPGEGPANPDKSPGVPHGTSAAPPG